MPLVSEVSFPSVLKGISVQFKPGKKRKKFARRPKKVEARLLSFDVGDRLDAAVEAFRAHLVTVLHDDATVREAMTAAVEAVGAYGAREITREFARQGITVGPQHWHLAAVAPTVDQLVAGLTEELQAAFADVQALLATKKLSGMRRETWLRHLMERAVAPIVNRAAHATINEGFARGRAFELRALVPMLRAQHLARKKADDEYPIDLSEITVVQTAIHDSALCEECEAVDGEAFPYGSERMDELDPPYALCLGRRRCRCTQFAVIGRDAIDVDEVSDEELEDLLAERDA